MVGRPERSIAVNLDGLDAAANVTYIVHLALVVPMLALEVPFSKWSHLAYRPLAVYLAQVRATALAKARGGAEPGRRGAEPAAPLRAA